MKKSRKLITLIMSVVSMLILISSVTAFAQTNYSTDIVLTIEETTQQSVETTHISTTPDNADFTSDSITDLNKSNSYIQTGSVMRWSLPIAIFTVICTTLIVIWTIRHKKLKE